MPANLENSAVARRLEKVNQFSFQSQRKAILKNVQTTTHLYSCHMLARSWSKSSKWGFNSTRTENFQMYKLDLEKSEEPEIKSSTLIHSSKKQESSRKNICFIDYTKTFDCVDHNKLWKILEKVRISDHLTYLLRNLYAGQEATVRTKHGKTDWFKIGKVVCQPCLLLLLLLSRFSRVRLCATPWAAAYQSSLSMGFSRQEHWSGLPFPSPMHESGKWKWNRSVVSDS